jgi:aldose 1-epimerase
MMSDLIELTSGPLSVAVDPMRGASITAFRYDAGGWAHDIFRTDDGNAVDPMATALQVLVPWVNRISGGGFNHDGTFHRLEPNRSGEPLPIHGTGFQQEWAIARQDPASVTLHLASEGPGPFAYEATYGIRLRAGCLELTLAVTNMARTALPFSLGFHPWFNRTPEACLQARARQMWLEDRSYLPTRPVDLDDPLAFDFGSLSHLPDQWINNTFTGWDGHAAIHWPELEIGLEIVSGDTDCFHVYSPGSTAHFFCFEPVSAIPDAINVLGYGHPGSPRVTAPGETFRMSCGFRPFQSDHNGRPRSVE